MISVVIQTLGDEDALLASLGALVSAAADGTLRDVIVVDGSGSARIAAIADGCGCTYLRSADVRARRLAVGAGIAKGPWLLFLEPGAEPEEGWYREARQFIERTERQGAVARRAATFRVATDDHDGAMAELHARFKRLFTARPAGRYALLINRSFYDRLGGFRELPVVEYIDLARRIGRSRIVRLRSRLFVTARAAAQSELGPGVRGVLGFGLLAARVPAGLVARLYG